MAETSEVKRILKTSNLYEILGVEKDCTANDLKRSYRKLAAKVHPDRCKEEGATEAFQKVSHAYQTLNDEDKRRNYDMFGDEKPQPQGQYYNGNGPYGNTQFYTSGEIDPEELFRAFFGGNFGPNVHFTYGGSPFDDIFNERVYVRRPRRQQAQHQYTWKDKISSLLYSFLPLIILFLLSSFSNLTGSGNSLKKDLARNIIFSDYYEGYQDFEDLDPNIYYKLRTSYYKKDFVIKKSWRNEMMRRYGARGFYQTITSLADDIYADKTKEQCRIDRKEGNRDSLACQEMRRYRIA